jgi:nucleotide-binding universal stress UspA family protein
MRRCCIAVTDDAVAQHAARAALTWCTQLGASALVLNVVTVPPLHRAQPEARVRTELMQRSQRFLEIWAAHGRQHDQALETLSVVQDGRGVAQTINDTAREHRCDVIAMGTHGLDGLNRAVIGSVAEGVVRHANLPVLLFKDSANPGPLERLLVAVDDSLGSELALRVARGLAQQTGAGVGVVHVVANPLFPHTDVPDTSLERALIHRAEHTLEGVERLRSTLINAAPNGVPEAILETAARQGSDLLVLGTHGREGVDRLLFGSVAEGVARHASLPVLLVRGTPEAVEDRTQRTEFEASDR